VALAVEQEDSEGVRWFAWRDGDAVGACLAQGKTTFREVGPVPLGLTAAELYPIGWQPSTQNAIFVARGTAAAGGPALAIVALSGQAGKGSARAIAVGGPAAPERWAVQRRGAAELDLVTAGAAAPGRPGVRVERQTITLASGKAGAPATLADHSGPLAALAAAPVAEPAGGVVDVLYGPSPQSGYMSFARLPLGGGPVRASWDFSPPAAPDPKRPTLWALPPAPLTPPLVVARAGDKIFARRAGGEWKVLATGAAQADQLRLAASPEAGAVAIWSDPTVGLRYLAIP
jgi:hypothetical protein